MPTKKSLIIINLLVVTLLFQPSLFAKSANNMQLTILTDHFPPLTYQNKKGEFVGSADLIIKKLFKEAHLNYQIKSYPWVRALKLLDENVNHLIYPLSRSKKREQQYIWIAPLFHLEIKTYGLNKNYVNIDVTEGDYQFVCIQTTINCQAVNSLNVPNSALSIISNISVKQMIKMVLQGRVDFFMSTESEFNYTIKNLGIDPKLFRELVDHQYVVTDYLAAKTGINPSIVKQLKAALVSNDLPIK
jgi:polar amino acid transport system substrate-binding protein